MGVEALANYYLINTNTSLSNKVKNDTAGKKNPGDNVYTTLDVHIRQVANDPFGYLPWCHHCNGSVSPARFWQWCRIPILIRIPFRRSGMI